MYGFSFLLFIHLLNYKNKVENSKDSCSRVWQTWVLIMPCPPVWPWECLYLPGTAPPCLWVWDSYSEPATCCELYAWHWIRSLSQSGGCSLSSHFLSLDFPSYCKQIYPKGMYFGEAFPSLSQCVKVLYFCVLAPIPIPYLWETELSWGLKLW